MKSTVPNKWKLNGYKYFHSLEKKCPNEEPSPEYVYWKKRLNGYISRDNTAKFNQKKIRENLSLLKLENSKKLQRQNEDLDIMESSNKELIEADGAPLTSLKTGIGAVEEKGRSLVGATFSTVHNGDFNRKWQLGIDWAKWFPPVTSRTFLSHYLPAFGAVSHTLHTIHLFSPNIISGLFPTGGFAVSNMILFNANVGLGFYVYFRRHLHRVNPWERVEFSILTLTIFNFVSSRAAVLIKSIFPSKTQTWLRTLFATSFSLYLLSRGYRYMGLLDVKSSSVLPVSLSSPIANERTNI